MNRVTSIAVALALALPATAAPRTAHARSQLTLTYPADRVFAAAVRFLRVDEDARILEKDADAGYVLFELDHGDKVHRGALELVRQGEDDRPRVTVVLTLTDLPDYLEATMLERLRRKLRAELGEEPPAPPPRPPPAPPAKPGNPADPPTSPPAGQPR